ncbi:AMP-binding protein [Alkalilimnicola ehrlichii]|nr:AMP-binding protein [Alkalilimnicola ehrlichii]
MSQPFPEFRNLVDVSRYRAERHGDKLAYSMLKYGVSVDDQMTYRQLDARARALAGKLQQSGLVGRTALLVFPPGLEFVVAFMGCLYAGVVAVPTALPGRKSRDWEKTAAIADDARVAVVLTVAEQHDVVSAKLFEHLRDKSLAILATDDVREALADLWVPSDQRADALAFLQYTSGSTGMPKGVMVTHGNLIHNQQMMRRAYLHDERTVYVSWLPLFHDMGLIGSVLQSLYVGGQCHLMTPVAFLQQPLRWLQAISELKATTSFAPNFAYELCLRRITEEQRDRLDLSHWRLALNGAEPVRAETLERFAEYFAPCGFKWRSHFPAYGLAEGTLFVSGTGSEEEPYIVRVDKAALQNHRVVVSEAVEGTQCLVSSGRPDTDQEVAIVNPDNLGRCASHEVGEIWIRGGSVAVGYWGKEEESRSAFGASIRGEEDGAYLRTGDLGFITDGWLFITGRLKDVLIINGANFYPQDIEAAVQRSHPALRSGGGAVFSVEGDGREEVVVVQEVERTHLRRFEPDEVTRRIRQAVSEEFQIAVSAIVLIKPMTLPLTSSGKVQRRRTRDLFLKGRLAEVAAWPASSARAEQRESNRGGLEATPAPKHTQSTVKANELIRWLRGYAEHRINSALIDERRCVPPYIVMDFANQGLFGMCVDESQGGLGLSLRDALRVIEQLAAIDANLATLVSLHHVLGSRPVMAYGSEAQQRRFLTDMAKGRTLGAFALSEPGAGSNPRAITATARPSGQGGWLIDGDKCWIGNGSWAGVINIFAQVQDDEGRSRGLAAFVVEQGRAGIRIGEEAPTMGMRGMVQTRLHFKDLHVTESDLLGRVGQGMAVAQDAMMQGRLFIAAMSLGVLKRCVQLMVRYADRREVSTGRLLENPVSIQRLDDLRAAVTVVQAMVDGMADCVDRQVPIPPEVYAACKIVAPEWVWTGVDQLVQMLGGRGYVENNPASRMMRDIRLFRIMEGPTESLASFFGSRVLGSSSDFNAFLEFRLQAPGVAQDITEMAVELLALASDGVGSLSAGQRRQLAQAAVGEVAALYVARAFLDMQTTRDKAASLEHARDWLERRIKLKHAEVVAMLGHSHAWPTATQLTDFAEGLANDIGDVVQQAPGVELALDAILARNPAGSAASAGDDGAVGRQHVTNRGDGVSAAVAEAAAPSPGARKHELEAWIMAWLVKRCRGLDEIMEAQAAFSDLGVDSVTAVELAFDLQTWLGFAVDPAAVWQHATIEALAESLASKEASGAIDATGVSQQQVAMAD